MAQKVQQPTTYPRPASCSEREAGGDFFCLRFKVWYPSADCAFRTRYRTFTGCENCDQGRFNARRHAPGGRRRWAWIPSEELSSNATG